MQAQPLPNAFLPPSYACKPSSYSSNSIFHKRMRETFTAKRGVVCRRAHTLSLSLSLSLSLASRQSMRQVTAHTFVMSHMLGSALHLLGGRQTAFHEDAWDPRILTPKMHPHQGFIFEAMDLSSVSLKCRQSSQPGTNSLADDHYEVQASRNALSLQVVLIFIRFMIDSIATGSTN